MASRKTALVTGSTSGIGESIADALAKQGFDIVLNGFGDEATIDALRARLAGYGVDVHHDGADMSKPAQIQRMIEGVLARTGTIDVLVNNAGIQHVAPVHEFPPEKWDAIIAINLSSAFHTTRLVIPGMKARRWGRIINIGSVHAMVASAYKTAYTAAKHGIAGFTKSVALEVAQEGITVNCICPGYVRTPLVERQIPDQAKAHGLSEDEVIDKVMLAGQPTRRFVGLDEIGGLAAYLVSDAARSFTGAMLTMDGGWTAQ